MNLSIPCDMLGAMVIRPEQPEDREAVYEVNRAAFAGTAEADLVDALRGKVSPLISLVAVEDKRVVSHIFFTPVTVKAATDDSFMAMALGPMAVHPEFQRRGNGSRLVRAGLDACRAMDQDIIFVVGHPSFYPRFGFVPARPLGITWDRPVPDDVFMVCELRRGALRARRGTVTYHPEFDRV